MNDLFEALKVSIRQYMEVDSLTPRKKQQVKETYGKFIYNMDTVDSILNFDKEEKSNEEE